MKFGKVMVEQSGGAEVFANMIAEMHLKPPILVKPNWGFSKCFTEAQILDWVLSAVDGEALVVESYGWARTEEALLGKGLGSKQRGALRKSDQWFLGYSGVGEVLKKHGVEYLNLTEEVWKHRVVEPQVIRETVEAKYLPVQMTELYNMVPTRIYNLRGGTLLSLAKIRVGVPPIMASLSVKNLFGLITTPSRVKFHGKKNSRLAQSIVDINKIYRSLFEIKGIIEAVFTASNIEGAIVKGSGIVLASEDTVELDAFTASLTGIDPNKVEHLKLAAEYFGKWDDRNIAHGKQSGIRVF